MGVLIKLLAVWGIADSMWLTLRPQQWSGFWGQAVHVIGDNKTYGRAVAAAQMAVCLWMLRRK
jgi:hypothetical protein